MGRLGRGWLFALVAAVLVGAVAIIHSPLMSVRTIDIRGAAHTDVERIVAESGLGPGAILLWVDTDSLRESIAAEPWVADVRVGRIWPDTVSIEVVEREEVVWIEGVLGWMLVARDGHVLQTTAIPGSNLMKAELAMPDRDPGERPDDPAWTEVVEMALVLSDDVGSTLTLEMRGPELWTEAFGHEVRLGSVIDLADKARTLRAILGEDVPGGAIIDVSSPTRPAIVPIEAQLGVESGDSEG